MSLPVFGPKVVAGYEQFTLCDLCRELLDETAGKDTIDAAVDYACHIPVRVIVKMLGFPQEDADIFREFIHLVIEAVDLSAEERERRFDESAIDEYLDARIAEHLAELVRIDAQPFCSKPSSTGSKLHPDHVRGTIILLMIAGIDTTWSAIGASLWHLAQNAEDRRRLATEPEAMDDRGRGTCRATPGSVTMARMVAEDFEFQGCPFKKDDWVLLPFPSVIVTPKRSLMPTRSCWTGE